MLRQAPAGNGTIEPPPGTARHDFAPSRSRKNESARPRLRLTSPKANEVLRSEATEQAAVIIWAGHACRQWQELRFLFAVPNGGKREAVTAAMLKRTGCKPGVPDLLLPVPRHGHTGLAIEMKIRPNKPTDLQRAWLDALVGFGWRCEVCYSASEAIEALRAYISAPRTVIGHPMVVRS